MTIITKPDLEHDLLNSEWIKSKCQSSMVYSQNLYAALCNNKFFYGDKEWTCSWRHSAGIVSDIRNCGEDYMSWYCSGVSTREEFVTEGFATEEIRLDLIRLGWTVQPYEGVKYAD